MCYCKGQFEGRLDLCLRFSRGREPSRKGVTELQGLAGSSEAGVRFRPNIDLDGVRSHWVQEGTMKGGKLVPEEQS